MAGKHTEKLTILVDNLSRQNNEQHMSIMQLGVQLGIYQGTFGPVPTDLAKQVIETLNAKPDKAATFTQLVAESAAIAADMMRKAQEEAMEQEAPPSAAGSRSPYSAADAGPTTPRLVLGTQDTPQAGRAPLSRLVIPAGLERP